MGHVLILKVNFSSPIPLKVIRGHSRSPNFFAKKSKGVRGVGLVSIRLSLQGASTDVEYGLLGSPRDLDLRSNYDLDLSKSLYMVRRALPRQTR